MVKLVTTCGYRCDAIAREERAAKVFMTDIRKLKQRDQIKYLFRAQYDQARKQGRAIPAGRTSDQAVRDVLEQIVERDIPSLSTSEAQKIAGLFMIYLDWRKHGVKAQTAWHDIAVEPNLWCAEEVHNAPCAFCDSINARLVCDWPIDATGKC